MLVAMNGLPLLCVQRLTHIRYRARALCLAALESHGKEKRNLSQAQCFREAPTHHKLPLNFD